MILKWSLNLWQEFAALGDPGGCIRTYELAFEKLSEICPTKGKSFSTVVLFRGQIFVVTHHSLISVADQLRVLDLFQEADRSEEALKVGFMTTRLNYAIHCFLILTDYSVVVEISGINIVYFDSLDTLKEGGGGRGWVLRVRWFVCTME